MALYEDGNEQTILTRAASTTDGSASFGAFRPGTNTISWVVPTQEGIDSAVGVTQTLNIEPQVMFGPAAVIPVGEGSQVTIPVFLNGSAPQYPIIIEYSVSGNASNPEDHNAISGTVDIISGTKGEIKFNVASDNIYDANEEIIFTLHSPQNASLGLKSTQRVVITETYVPPHLDLIVDQFGYDSSIILNNTSSAASTVTASVAVVSFNAAKNIDIDWSATDNALLTQSTISNNQLTFAATSMPNGTYKIRATVTDYEDPEYRQYHFERTILSHDLSNLLELPQPPADVPYIFATSAGATINWPFVPENVEVVFQPQPLYTARLGSYNFRLFTEKLPIIPGGLKLRRGDISLQANSQTGGYNLVKSDIAEYGGPNGGPSLYPADDNRLPDQIVEFEIAGLTTPGQRISIVIPQESPVPENPLYRKYMPHTGWVTFVENANNSLASTIKVNGICPPPGDSAYTPGLAAGDNCIQLTIEDGGPNDADQQANSIIKDPGGVTSETATTTSVSASSDNDSGGGGGGGLNLLWLLMLFIGRKACRFR
ncbi:MAG: hypothetical protein L3J89_10165 [Gammaproteobacteria bacterium]|nr:hypothetical protein [Gammaproteobacteria bacterium]